MGINHTGSNDITAPGAPVMTSGPIRVFETGATRDQDATKHDPSGFMSPLVALRFCEYMTKHRVQPDGSIRASDNWQKGMPLNAYAESEWRHHLDLWLHHRGYGYLAREGIEEALCGILFNVQGYLHELIKRRLPVQGQPTVVGERKT